MTVPLTTPDHTLSCSQGIHTHCSRPDTCTCRCHGGGRP